MQSSLDSNKTYVAALLDRDWRMLIGGDRVAAGDGATMEITAPHDGSTIARVPAASPPTSTRLSRPRRRRSRSGAPPPCSSARR